MAFGQSGGAAFKFRRAWQAPAIVAAQLEIGASGEFSGVKTCTFWGGMEIEFSFEGQLTLGDDSDVGGEMIHAYSFDDSITTHDMEGMIEADEVYAWWSGSFEPEYGWPVEYQGYLWAEPK